MQIVLRIAELNEIMRQNVQMRRKENWKSKSCSISVYKGQEDEEKHPKDLKLMQRSCTQDQAKKVPEGDRDGVY